MQFVRIKTGPHTAIISGGERHNDKSTSEPCWLGGVSASVVLFLYAVTEMEETAVMNSAECFGLEDRVISLRVIVNMDTFLKGESPEQLWLDEEDFADGASAENGETVDIFEPGMKNLFDTARIINDAILAGAI